MYHRARDVGAGGPDFQENLARLERELDAEWDFDELRSAHFQIAFAGGARDSNAAARAVSDGLEDAYFHVGHKLDLYPGERVQVVLYASEDFHDITQTPSWTGGVYDGRIKLPSRGVEDGDSAVIEECMIALWVSPAAVPSLFMPGRVLDLDCDRWVVGRARGYSRCAWPGT